jgi:MSHA biogenesis protein MshK
VSLVLEALKKLDREKGRDERGFVVMAAAPWPARAAARWPMWAALGVAAASMAAVLVLRADRPAPAPPASLVPAETAVPAGTHAIAAPPPLPAVASVRTTAPETADRPAAASRRSLAVTAPPAAAAAAAAPGSVLQPFPAPAVAADTAVAAATTVAPAAASTAPPAEPVLRLQAISARDGQPIAIVNGRLLRVGDEVDGARILAIRGTEVDVDVHGRRTTLRF